MKQKEDETKNKDTISFFLPIYSRAHRSSSILAEVGFGV